MDPIFSPIRIDDNDVDKNKNNNNNNKTNNNGISESIPSLSQHIKIKKNDENNNDDVCHIDDYNDNDNLIISNALIQIEKKL